MVDGMSVLGGAAFLGASAALVYAGAVAGVVREALNPERKTLGWALGRGLPSEPTAWGLRAREWTHEWSAGGRGALCPVFDLGDDSSDAATAVVLHGFGRSRYDALSRLGPFIPHAQRFLMPDLPGHGDAQGRGTRLGTDEDAFLADFVAKHTAGPVLLVGHSLGATVAIHAALDERIRARVRGIIALAPYESLRTPLGARLDLRGMPRRALTGPAISVMAAFGVRERSTREAATKLACPLAVLAGAADPVTPLAEATAIAQAAARHRLGVIAHARHDDFQTLGREEMVAAAAWIVHQP